MIRLSKFEELEELTALQVLTGSFAIRLNTTTKTDIYPASLGAAIEQKAPNFANWVKAVSAHPSVSANFDGDEIVKGLKARIAKLKASA